MSSQHERHIGRRIWGGTLLGLAALQGAVTIRGMQSSEATPDQFLLMDTAQDLSHNVTDYPEHPGNPYEGAERLLAHGVNVAATAGLAGAGFKKAKGQ